ncbi:MAG: HNH endonuclease, partial [Acidimicrobiia bacterium]
GEAASLVAVTTPANRTKNDRDPAQWRPPRPEAWCGFARDWVTVKLRWDLTADEAEAGALREMLATC